jgi:tryptophanyl-tRNA synthetase
MNILTGLQPTGALHIGNYFGAIMPMADKSRKLQAEDNMYMMAADLHALTIELDYTKFYDQIIQNLKLYIASGFAVDKPNVNLFRQSFVPAHSELAWLLSCFSYFGEMSRMTQFKDKSSQHGNNINVGLLSYPILMAADILLYDALYVPVGEDQQQHIELARNLAIRLNNKFNPQISKDLFVVPESYDKQNQFFALEKPLRIKSLTDPTKKMSKSSPDTKSKLLLSDVPTDGAKKIMGATTDTLGQINYNPESQPGITNLMDILGLITDTDIEQVKKEWTGNTRYGDFKKHVAGAVEAFLVNLQSNLSNVTNQDVELALKKGETNANIKANQTLLRVQKTLGLR